MRTTARHLRKSLLLGGLLCLLAAPVTSRVAARADTRDAGLVFPPPPAAPRLVYQEALSDASAYRGERSFLGRVADFLVGGEEAAVLDRPHGLACAGTLLLIADPDAGLVHAFDRDDHSYRRIPRKGRLASPVDAAAGPDGRIYVADAAAGALVVFDAEGREVARTAEHVVRPAGLALDPAAGRLYAADPGAHHIAVFDLELEPVTTFGDRGEGPGSFNFPVDVCLGDDGVLWVLDALNYRVCALSRDGGFLSSFGAQGDAPGAFARPRGLTLDADGHLWVSDALQDGVQVFDREGRLLLALGVRGRGAGEFWMPAGLAFDDDGRLYVADAYNHRVQVFRYLADAEGGRP